MKKWMVMLGVILVAVVLAVVLTRPETSLSPGFLLTIAEPQDESVVRTSEIVVAGVTQPDAVLSVNGALIDIDAEGNFSTTVSLEVGPNSIEVIASDYEGNEASEILSVIYVP